MLQSVTTQWWNGTAYTPVDTWNMSYAFPATGETGVSPSLWLDDVDQVGLNGGSAITPALHFGGNNHGNLVSATAPYYNHVRLEEIDNGQGGKTTVAYSPQECTPANVGTIARDQNAMRCYPQWNGSAWVFYHKYVVTQVTDTDMVGSSPTDSGRNETTTFAYSTGGSSTNVLWHYDSNEAALPVRRTWSDFAGYDTVTATHGTTAGQQNITTTRYYRGMDNDVLGDRVSKRHVVILDSTTNVNVVQFTDRGSPDTGSDLRLFIAYMSGTLAGCRLVSLV
jgi:hypothetical protein